MWNEGLFGLGKTFIETLTNALSRFDFAILVLTPDDFVQSRSTEVFGPRDNVVFELGLFMGRLGRERTFILHQSDGELKIPTDLSGVTSAVYRWPREDRSHKAAVGAASDSIRNAIRDLGVSDVKAHNQIRDIKSRQESAESQLRTLQIVIRGLVTHFEYDKLRGLAAEGPFMVKFHNDMYEELKRLDAIRYVKPRVGYGIISIRERDGRGDEFDLKQYVEITSNGLEYLKLRDGD